MSDPTSWLHASSADWDHPLSFEGMALLSIYDLQLQSKVKRHQFKPHPRPWPARKKKLGGNNKVRRSAEEVRRILRPL